MPNYVFAPGSSHTAHVPITVAQAGLALTVQVWLTTKQNSSGPGDAQIGNTGLANIASSIAGVNVVNVPMIFPAFSGALYAAAQVIYQGQIITALVDTVNVIQAPGGSTGAITWD